MSGLELITVRVRYGLLFVLFLSPSHHFSHTFYFSAPPLLYLSFPTSSQLLFLFLSSCFFLSLSHSLSLVVRWIIPNTDDTHVLCGYMHACAFCDIIITHTYEREGGHLGGLVLFHFCDQVGALKIKFVLFKGFNPLKPDPKSCPWRQPSTHLWTAH